MARRDGRTTPRADCSLICVQRRNMMDQTTAMTGSIGLSHLVHSTVPHGRRRTHTAQVLKTQPNTAARPSRIYPPALPPRKPQQAQAESAPKQSPIKNGPYKIRRLSPRLCVSATMRPRVKNISHSNPPKSTPPQSQHPKSPPGFTPTTSPNSLPLGVNKHQPANPNISSRTNPLPTKQTRPQTCIMSPISVDHSLSPQLAHP
ncbi:hypothetical protein RSSM_00158 [Rhodopirellula sallentina SM41]|uniref:Uncharacterized protein n=1 Tax=Rhodopirellula sallentina SM41 TaxID=1263870 RepID=M5UAR0_9BACT|nr:hypothetical protein RSSM_00158 [Rhodopirellula sallentina SM41]